MARVNQGYYRELRKKFKQIEEEFNCFNTYAPDKTLIGDSVPLWGDLCEFNQVFINIGELRQ